MNPSFADMKAESAGDREILGFLGRMFLFDGDGATESENSVLHAALPSEQSTTTQSPASIRLEHNPAI